MYTFINFLDEEDGIGVVELILILVVLIGRSEERRVGKEC